MSVLCVIPARGGSKRIPQKNIKNFCGKPIIGYSIEAAIKTDIFDKVIVSTDDPSIANIGREFGAEIPFFRTKKNSDDYATLADTLIEVIEKYRELGETFDIVACLLATAPFITSNILKEAFLKIKEEEIYSVMPIVTYSFPIQRSLKRSVDGKVEMNWKEYYSKRSQDLEEMYHDAGLFYFIKTEILTKSKLLYTEKNFGILVDELYAQDIDTERDWNIAEMKFRINMEKVYGKL